MVNYSTEQQFGCQLSGANYLGVNYQGGNYTGDSYPGGNFPAGQLFREQFSGGICLGGNYPGGNCLVPVKTNMNKIKKKFFYFVFSFLLVSQYCSHAFVFNIPYFSIAQ